MENYSFKNYIDFIFDPSHVLSDEQFNSLPKIKTKLGTEYTKISQYNELDKLTIYSKEYIFNPNIKQVSFNECDDMLLVSNNLLTSITFRLFFSQKTLLKYLNIDNTHQFKTISFNSDGKLLYSTLDNFPEINIKEIDEEMDLYLTMKYLNN